MEEILVVILQVIFELALQVLAELPWDLFVGSRESASPRETGPGLWVVLSLVAGGAVGGISLLIFPETLIHWSDARMANLLVAPALTGCVAFAFSRSTIGPTGKPSHPRLRGVCAACFTLAVALIRFTYATRPGK